MAQPNRDTSHRISHDGSLADREHQDSPMLAPLLILSLFTGNLAASRDPTWQWDVPTECPDLSELHRRLQREHSGRSATTLEVSASIAHDRYGYLLSGEVAVDGRRQQLDLRDGKSCDELVATFVLYLGPLLPDPDPKPTHTVASRRFNGYLRAAGEVDIWTLCPGSECKTSPFPTWGGVFAGGWFHPRMRVELIFPLHTAISEAAKGGPFGALTTRWVRTGARIRVCGAIGRARFDLLLCGELGLQLLFGMPRADANDFEATTPVLAWGTVRLVPAFVWWIHLRVGLRLEIAPGVNLHPNDYQVYDQIKGEEERRPLAAIGWFHTAFGVGMDVRLGRRHSR